MAKKSVVVVKKEAKDISSSKKKETTRNQTLVKVKKEPTEKQQQLSYSEVRKNHPNIKKKRKVKQSTIAKREIKKWRKVCEPILKMGSFLKLLKKTAFTEFALLTGKKVEDIYKEIHVSAKAADILRHQTEEFGLQLIQNSVLHSARISSNKKTRRMEEPPFVKSSDIAFIAQIKYPDLIKTGGLSNSKFSSLVYNDRSIDSDDEKVKKEESESDESNESDSSASESSEEEEELVVTKKKK